MKRFSAYLDEIARSNQLDDKGQDIKWLFHPGMLFLSMDKWWGDYKYRATDHEGIDITYYMQAGKISHFDESFKIPAFSDGTLIQTCNDFLGQSIVVDISSENTNRFRTIMVYAHIKLVPDLKIGIQIGQNEIVATVCDTHKNPQLLPHLHLSCFEVPDDVPGEKMNWKLFSSRKTVRMINPFFL